MTTIEMLAGPDRGGWTEVWHCEMPAGAFRVRREEWRGEGRERHIYEVEPAVAVG